MINKNDIPNWLLKLEPEDINFIRKFTLCSGSLKDMAEDYGVTYPTMRLRLNRLIEKIRIDEPEDDAFVGEIKKMVLDEKITYDAAKEIITKYRKGNE